MRVVETEKGLKVKKHYLGKEKHNYYKAWKASGLSQSKFCEMNNLAGPTFSRWVRELENESSPPLSFVPLKTIAEKAMVNQGVTIQFSNGLSCHFSELTDLIRICKFVRELHDAFVNG